MHLDSSWIDRLFSWLIQTSWQTSVLVCLILAVQFVFRKGLSPAWRCALWMLVIVRLALPASIESAASVFNLARLEPVQSMATRASPSAARVIYGEPATATVTTQEKHEQSKTMSTSPAIDKEPQQTGAIAWNMRQKFVVLWLTVMAILFARVVYRNFLFSSPVIRRRPVTDKAILDLLQDCKDEMDVHVPMDLIETSKVDSPALLGFVRPRLLLPPNMLETFSREKLRYFFLHELSHFKRGDIPVNWVISILQVIHWFNPFVWLAFSRLRVDREAACDAHVIAHCSDDRAGRNYGEAILDVIEFASRTHWLPGVVGILEDKQQITWRITMIANYREYPRWTKALAAGLLCALGVLTLTDAQSQQTSARAAPATEPGKVEMSGQLVLIESSSVKDIEKQLGMDLDSATGRTLLTEAEAAALLDALQQNGSAHLVGEGTSTMNVGESAVFKSIQDIAFNAPEQKIRQIGWIQQGTVTKDADDVRATFSPEWVDLLGTRKVRDFDLPLFQSLNCAMDFKVPAGSYVLLRGNRAPLRNFQGASYGESLGAQLRERSLDYFMLLSAKSEGSAATTVRPMTDQAMLVCRIFSLGPDAQKIMKNSAGMKSMNSSLSMSPKSYRDLLNSLAGAPDAQTLSSVSVVTSTKTHAQSQWVVEVIYWNGTKFETRKCGLIFDVTPTFNNRKSEIDLAMTTEFTFPPPQPDLTDGFSPLTILTDRKATLAAGQTFLTSVSAPSGILPEHYRCFMAVTARVLGDDRTDE